MKFNSFIFGVLALCSICCHLFVDQYEPSGSDLLTPDWLMSAGEDQTARIELEHLFLDSQDSKRSVFIRQAVKSFPVEGHLQVSARMQYTNVVAGSTPWNKARLLLVQNDGNKDRWDIAHTVAAFEGSGQWKSYHAVFPVSLITKKITVMAQLSQCVGSFELEDIRLFSVVQTSTYTWTGRVMLGAWACFGILLLASCLMRAREGWLLKLMAAAAFVLVLVGTCMPVEMKKEVSQSIVKQVSQVAHMAQDHLPRDYSKFGHLFCFTLLGITLAAAMKDSVPLGVVFLNLLFVAGGTEMSQFFIEGRSPLFQDFLLDSGGGLLGILFNLKRKSLWRI